MRKSLINLVLLISLACVYCNLVEASPPGRARCDNLLTQPAGAVLRLFPDGKAAKNFNDLVKKIVPGVKLAFDSGNEFEVGSFIGSGMTTLIFDLRDGWLLRVPSYHYAGSDFPDAVPFILDFQKMQPELKKNGVPVVDIDWKRTVPGEVTVVKREKFDFTLKQYLESSDSSGEDLDLKKTERGEIEDKLIEFARKTWMYSYIGDFSADQIGYNGEDWVLFDFGVNNGVFNSALIEKFSETRNAFTHFSEEPLAAGRIKKRNLSDMSRTYRNLHVSGRKRRKKELRIYSEINDVISKERSRQKKSPELLNQIQAAGTYTRDSADHE